MNTERKSKQFWAEKGNNVILVTGYECPPNSRDWWWVPELGYSASEGCRLFNSEEAALKMAIKNAEHEKNQIQTKLASLRQQLARQ